VDHAVVAAGLSPITSRGKLLQVLGVSFGIAVLLGNTILVGILRTPGNVAAWLPNPWVFLGVWVMGGLYALLGAISMAEPGALVARSGGQYVLVRRGLGEYPGFVVGWSDWISTCASVSLGAMVRPRGDLEQVARAGEGRAGDGLQVQRRPGEAAGAGRAQRVAPAAAGGAAGARHGPDRRVAHPGHGALRLPHPAPRPVGRARRSRPSSTWGRGPT
jgi:hypothetical protein